MPRLKKNAKYIPTKFKKHDQLLQEGDYLNNRIQVVFSLEDKLKILKLAEQNEKAVSEFCREIILRSLRRQKLN